MGSDKGLFKPDLVFFDFQAVNPEDLFTQLGEILLERGFVTRGWLSSICARERSYPTGLMTVTTGCAIPHTDPEFIVEPYIAVVIPRNPIIFQPMAMIGDPVPARIVINLGVRRDGGQVQVLQTLMSTFMDEQLVIRIMRQTTPQALLHALTEKFS